MAVRSPWGGSGWPISETRRHLHFTALPPLPARWLTAGSLAAHCRLHCWGGGAAWAWSTPRGRTSSRGLVQPSGRSPAARCDLFSSTAHHIGAGAGGWGRGCRTTAASLREERERGSRTFRRWQGLPRWPAILWRCLERWGLGRRGDGMRIPKALCTILDSEGFSMKTEGLGPRNSRVVLPFASSASRRFVHLLHLVPYAWAYPVSRTCRAGVLGGWDWNLITRSNPVFARPSTHCSG